MKNKIFVSLSTFADSDNKPLALLKESGFDYYINSLGRRITEDEVLEMGVNATGIIAGLEPYTSDVLLQLKNLKCISRVGVGTDNIDNAYAKTKGIIIRNTPNVVIQPVVELTLTMILTLLRKATLHTNLIKLNKWERHVGNLLYGKTVGIIGTGRIGKRMSETLLLLGANIIAYDIYPDLEWQKKLNVKYISRNDLYKNSDIISLHLSDSTQVKPVISKKEIEQMKDGVLIINTSRGQFIDEKDLFDGLTTEKVGGVGLDVYVNEPYNGDLINFDNVVLTPHIATLTKESRTEMEVEAVTNLLAVLNDSR